MRCALVTGGTRGIGRAICDALAAENFTLAVTYNKSKEKAAEMIDEYQSRGINCIAVQADLSEKDGADKLLEALKGFPRPDTLINNAGAACMKLLCDTDDIEAERLMQLNFFSPMKLMRELSRNMISRSFGRIVNVSSMWASAGSAGESVYAASKAALEGLSKSLAKELGASGITVNCVAPGLIDTEMNACLDKAAVSEIVASTPARRMGTPADVAKAVLDLVSEDSGFITGAVIPVTGGFSI